MWNSKVSGSVVDYEDFFEKLAGCTQLKKFAIDWDCKYAVTGYHQGIDIETQQNTWVADSVAAALSRLDRLEKVTLDANVDVSAEAMAQLCQAGGGVLELCLDGAFHLSLGLFDALCGDSSRVAALNLLGVEFHEHTHMEQLWERTRRHETIRKLSIDGPLRMAESLVDCLGEDTTLEEVAIDAFCEDDETSQRSTNVAAIQKARLRKLSLVFWQMHPMCVLGIAESLVRGLDQNEWTEELDWRATHSYGPEETEAITNTFKSLGSELDATLTETNTTLTYLNMVCECPPGDIAVGSSNDKSKYWMKLNQAGRKQLVSRPEDRKLWWETLLDKRHDVDVTFWLLSMNPALFFEQVT